MLLLRIYPEKGVIKPL